MNSTKREIAAEAALMIHLSKNVSLPSLAQNARQVAHAMLAELLPDRLQYRSELRDDMMAHAANGRVGMVLYKPGGQILAVALAPATVRGLESRLGKLCDMFGRFSIDFCVPELVEMQLDGMEAPQTVQ